MDLIARGAEAEIIKIDNKTLKKRRPPKPYRIQDIDLKIRKFRNKREFKVLTKLSEKGILAPKPLEINDLEIYFTMEFVEGKALKEVLNKELLFKAFSQVIQIHNEDITHGDLTTLNFIEKNNETYLIDFGLAEFTQKIEDKAVDLNLFFTCIKNEHPNLFSEKENLLEMYKKKVSDGKKILRRLDQVEKRGRNK